MDVFELQKTELLKCIHVVYHMHELEGVHTYFDRNTVSVEANMRMR